MKHLTKIVKDKWSGLFDEIKSKSDHKFTQSRPTHRPVAPVSRGGVSEGIHPHILYSSSESSSNTSCDPSSSTNSSCD